MRRIAIVLICLSVALAACAKIKTPEPIEASLIPAEIRQRIDDGHLIMFWGKPLKITWYVCEKNASYPWYAAVVESRLEGETDVSRFVWIGYSLSDDWDDGAFKAKNEPFYGQSGWRDYLKSKTLLAEGVATDSRVVSVKGVSTDGKAVECAPTNGFWSLVIEGASRNSTWQSIGGFDSRGHLVYSLK